MKELPYCSCKFSDAWRCAVDQNLTWSVACNCLCHTVLNGGSMLSVKEVTELQHDQIDECRKCARNPKMEFCPESLVLGETKMRMHQCEHFIARTDNTLLRCVKCKVSLPKDRIHIYCQKCYDELKGIKSKRMFRFGGENEF